MACGAAAAAQHGRASAATLGSVSVRQMGVRHKTEAQMHIWRHMASYCIMSYYVILHVICA